MSEDEITDVIDVNAPEVVEIPEGFDDTLFDTKAKTLKVDAVREKLNALNAEIESEKKQKLDMRRKLSKGVDVPSRIEEYTEGYALNEKYTPFLENEAIKGHISEVMGNIDKFASERGMRLDDTNALKDFALSYMESVSILEGEESKQANFEKVIEKTKEILGDDADNIVRDNDKFYANYGMFKDSKDWILDQSKSNPQANKFFYQVRSLLKGDSMDIPTTNVVSSNLPSDSELKREYLGASDERRVEIIKQRIASGRFGSFL